jgi:hypothetical protein
VRRRSVKKLGILLCTVLLAIIIGCQAVGGFSLNEMILKQIDVTQQEQSQKLELEVEFNEDLLSEEEPKVVEMIHAFKKVSLNITESKMDGNGHQWMTGKFTFGKGTIPFTFHSDSKAIKVEIGGASRPLVLELDASMNTSLQSLLPGMGMDLHGDVQQVIMKSIRQLAHNVASYFVNGLPNPPVVSVDRVYEPVNGLTTSLTKVHAELNGEQLGELLSVYLDNLVKDKEGFRTMLRSVVQWAMDLPPELQETFGGAEMFDQDFDMEKFVEEGVNQLFPMLEEAQQELKHSKEDADFKEVFDKGITMVADLYVDDSLHLRKSAVELNIAPAAFALSDSPVRSIKIRSSGEMWNVNGDVVVPPVVIPQNAIKAEDLVKMQPYQMLRLLDKSSVLYGVLKNDLGVDDQSFELSTEWGIPFKVDEKGVAYVPVRATMNDFGVRLSPHTAKGQIIFTDLATDQTFVFQVGSNKALVNEQSVTLDHKVLNDGHFVYVSADDLLGLLHAEYKVTKTEYGESIMKVTRDL